MTTQTPSIGRIVHYTLNNDDEAAINGRRDEDPRSGNRVSAGDIYPMMITRVWGDQPDSSVNGQVHLDGRDLHWVTSVSHGEGERHFAWPART